MKLGAIRLCGAINRDEIDCRQLFALGYLLEFQGVSCAKQLCCALRGLRLEVFRYRRQQCQELSAFPCAILNDTTAHEFASADDDVQAVADITDAEEANPIAAELAAAFRFATVVAQCATADFRIW